MEIDANNPRFHMIEWLALLQKLLKVKGASTANVTMALWVRTVNELKSSAASETRIDMIAVRMAETSPARIPWLSFEFSEVFWIDLPRLSIQIIVWSLVGQRSNRKASRTGLLFAGQAAA